MAVAKGYNVQNLEDYVKTNMDVLVKSIVLGDKYGDTVRNLRKQLGIKTSEKLNLLDVNIKLQDGRDCGFTPEGGTNFSERMINTAIAKINDEYCQNDLLGKFAEHLIKFGAEDAENNFPFETEILGEITKKVNKEIERQVWQGDISGSDLIDGFVTIAEGADSASTIVVSYPTGTTIYERVKNVISAIPEAILDDAVVFVSPANFRSLQFEMVEKNLYHYDAGKIENDDFIFPGSNVTVHKTHGLTGLDVVYASVWDNMVYGTDMMNDKEQVKVWYNEEDEKEKVKIRFNFGVQTLYPDMVVIDRQR